MRKAMICFVKDAAPLVITAVMGLAAGLCLAPVREWESVKLTDWIQAVGSLIAIGVAIYVPWQLQKVARRREMFDRRAQIRATAILVLHDLQALMHAINRALEEKSIPRRFVYIP